MYKLLIKWLTIHCKRAMWTAVVNVSHKESEKKNGHNSLFYWMNILWNKNRCGFRFTKKLASILMSPCSPQSSKSSHLSQTIPSMLLCVLLCMEFLPTPSCAASLWNQFCGKNTHDQVLLVDVGLYMLQLKAAWCIG